MVEDLCPEEMIAQVTPAVSVLSEGAGGARGLGSAELGRRLLLAARHGDTPLVLELMAKGAPFTTDWLGTSALHAAASGAHVDTCAVLLRAGVSRDCRTKVDRTPLHMAAHAGHAAVAQLLLDNHACVDCRDMLHMTPLHWAAERGHAAAAAALLRHGADPGAVSKFNKTPRSIAQARGRHHILRLIDDALREREAAKSVDELRLANETEESTAIEQQRTAEVTERLTETAAPKPTGDQTHAEPIKIHLERPLGGGWGAEGGGAEGGGGGAGGGAGAALLRRHGIAPLPADSGSTVLTALQSGRSVVLSDAGKLMLKESVPLSPGGRGAAPAPPARPVRVFALNNKLRAPPKESKHGRRVLPPHDMQIKFLQVPADKKVPIAKTVEMKAKTKLVPSPPAAAAAPPVKIMMKKANLSKLLPPAAEDHGLDAAAADKCNQNVVFVPEAFLTNDSPAYLRTQLLAAHRTIASLHAQLARCRARLARHEAP